MLGDTDGDEGVCSGRVVCALCLGWGEMEVMNWVVGLQGGEGALRS
jgi:hypothetical protein